MEIDCELYKSFGGVPPFCPKGNDCRTCRNPTNPDEGRERERDKGYQYKLVVAATEVLFEPEKVIGKFKAKIQKQALFPLLTAAIAVWNGGGSIDYLLLHDGYDKEVRQLVAHCIITLNDVRHLFWKKWYAHYESNINTVDTYLKSGIYHEQATNTYNRSCLNAPNRKPDVEKIIEHACEFLDYLKGHYADIDKARDGELYNIKGFEVPPDASW